MNECTLVSTNIALPDDGASAPKRVEAILMSILILFFLKTNR